jgi:hypothetical protein
MQRQKLFFMMVDLENTIAIDWYLQRCVDPYFSGSR